jgi:hypothetical protein
MEVVEVVLAFSTLLLLAHMEEVVLVNKVVDTPELVKLVRLVVLRIQEVLDTIKAAFLVVVEAVEVPLVQEEMVVLEVLVMEEMEVLAIQVLSVDLQSLIRVEDKEAVVALKAVLEVRMEVVEVEEMQALTLWVLLEIVILSAPIGTFSSVTGGTHTTSGGNDIWTFTSSGTWTPTVPSVAYNTSLSASMMNAVARYASVNRLGHFSAKLSVSMMNAAGRFASIFRQTNPFTNWNLVVVTVTTWVNTYTSL